MHFCPFSRFFSHFLYEVIRDFLIFAIKQCSIRHRDVQIFIVYVTVIRNINPEFGIVSNYC